jgi:hypothetical protein
MYDEGGFQVANPINRFAIGDRDNLKFNADGSLDIYIQHDNPGADKESDWLPLPLNGKLGANMRLYAPAPQQRHLEPSAGQAKQRVSMPISAGIALRHSRARASDGQT